MSVSRPGFFSLHFIPVEGAVILISVETGPLVIRDAIDPERIGDFGVAFSLTLILVFVQALKLKNQNK